MNGGWGSEVRIWWNELESGVCRTSGGKEGGGAANAELSGWASSQEFGAPGLAWEETGLGVRFGSREAVASLEPMCWLRN